MDGDGEWGGGLNWDGECMHEVIILKPCEITINIETVNLEASCCGGACMLSDVQPYIVVTQRIQ